MEQGIEVAYCNQCIKSLVGAWRLLMESSATEALYKVPLYDKPLSDTLGLDAIPESVITNRLTEFDRSALIVTEERDTLTHGRWPSDSTPERQPIMFFSDPTDRSTELKMFIKAIAKDNLTEKIGVLMNACDPVDVWHQITHEKPAVITGASTSLTCIRKGSIVFSVILNYITGTLFLASDAGVFMYDLKPYSDPNNEGLKYDEIVHQGKPVKFNSVKEQKITSDECRRFVTFLGKEGYRENFDDSGIFVGAPEEFLHHKTPPGPPRVLYLSELQSGYSPVGFILANGEKIGEWFHWLAFVKFARNGNRNQALRIFEIALKRPWTKNGMLMSTTEEYSLFSSAVPDMFVDISRLRTFRRPSQFRSMLVVLPHDNERIIHWLRQLDCRDVTRAL